MIDSARCDRRASLTARLTAAFVLLFCTAPSSGADQATCATCHEQRAEELSGSVHHAMDCQECHGGLDSYSVDPGELPRLREAGIGDTVKFDHGDPFLGKPARRAIPELCGNCHADVERMNAYGLRTDQLARYWTSGHGKTLRDRGDERVAVCVDCHASHEILPGREPRSRTYALNIPDACAGCHGDAELMASFDLPVEVVAEYRDSVHGRLLLEQQDTGAPTCATCHGNHSAMPPGFAAVGEVCGKCHEHAAQQFATSVHATEEGHRGCVQCHAGGQDAHFHLIERITKPAGVLIQRYASLLATEPEPSPEQITEAINPDPQRIMTRALPSCLACHEELDDDENLSKMFALLDEIAAAERHYVRAATRLDEIGKGVLLVENQRFKFEEAKTYLIELSPVQHTLDNELVAAKVAQLDQVCEEVHAELDELEAGLRLRHQALIPLWAFALLFSTLLYIKYRRLKRMQVKPPA